MSVDTHGQCGAAWIGVDLDGTLARYDGWQGSTHIGLPIDKMLNRVIKWISGGSLVKIMTARVSPEKDDCDVCRRAIELWLDKHVYPLLPPLDGSLSYHIPITHCKDHLMIELWDDRVVQVVPNTGERVDGKE